MFIRKANLKDAKKIFKTVNLAYIIEVGNTGVAFKKTNRYINLKEVCHDIKMKNGQFFYL